MGYCYYLWTVYGNIYSVLLEKANRHKKMNVCLYYPVRAHYV